MPVIDKELPAAQWLKLPPLKRYDHSLLIPADTLRPRGISPVDWIEMERVERSAHAMHAKTEEMDFRGGLSDMKPLDICITSLELVAMLTERLGEETMVSLIRRGVKAANEV